MKKFKLVKDKWYFQSLRETKSVKELDDWAVEISWYASTKDKDRWWDVVEPKAFASALERYMTNPIVLLQHKAEKPIGIVEEANIDDNWLYIKAKISQNTDWVVDLIKNWVLRAFSIWYSVKDYETDVRELADWTYDMTNIIKDLELYEISVVSIPMNPYALSKSVEDLLEVEESVEEQKEESSEENVVDLWAEENEAEMHIESESKEESDDEVQESEKNDEENTDDIVEWNQESEEKSDEWTNIQSEEKSAEIETSETTESEEEWKVVEWEIVQGEEEVVEEESIEQKSEEIAHDEETWAENEQNEADENSEISDEESNEEDSENDVETTSDDEVVDETSNNEVVETKSIETESQKQFDFDSKIASLSKSFDEKLAEKDEKIKSLESKVETMTKLFAESLETIDSMMTAVKNTPVNAGLQYKRPLKKWWYYDIASIIKNL